LNRGEEGSIPGVRSEGEERKKKKGKGKFPLPLKNKRGNTAGEEGGKNFLLG